MTNGQHLIYILYDIYYPYIFSALYIVLPIIFVASYCNIKKLFVPLQTWSVIKYFFIQCFWVSNLGAAVRPQREVMSTHELAARCCLPWFESKMQLTSLWHGKVFRCCPNNTKRKDLKTKTPVIRNRLTLKFSIMTKILSILLLSLPFLTSGVNSCNNADDLSDARIIIQGKNGQEIVNLDLMTVAKAIPENLNFISSPLTSGQTADSLKAVYLLKKNGFTDEEIALLNQEKCPEYTEYINTLLI